MPYRQKILLALLQIFGGTLKPKDLQKHLFLFINKYQISNGYDFIPYKYGCFSFQSYADRRNMVKNKILDDTESWELSSNEDFLSQLTQEDQFSLLSYHKNFKALSGNDLIHYVYSNYPYYAINSKIINNINLSPEEIKKIEGARPKISEHCFFTIGYEGRTPEEYLNILLRNDVKVLCDVRRNPISRKYGFSKKTLQENLENLGIMYIHYPELGIASSERKNLQTRQDYEEIFEVYENTVLKQAGDTLAELKELLSTQERIAVTCFEADFSYCHRGRIAKKFAKATGRKYKIKHL